jgi:hypothetical protein
MDQWSSSKFTLSILHCTVQITVYISISQPEDRNLHTLRGERAHGNRKVEKHWFTSLSSSFHILGRVAYYGLEPAFVGFPQRNSLQI